MYSVWLSRLLNNERQTSQVVPQRILSTLSDWIKISTFLYNIYFLIMLLLYLRNSSLIHSKNQIAVEWFSNFLLDSDRKICFFQQN